MIYVGISSIPKKGTNNKRKTKKYIDRRGTKKLLVRFQVLTAMNMKMIVFWDVAPW
jgi:hypothetical protein